MVCEHCGTIFCYDADISPEEKNRKRFCSRTCKVHSSQKRTGGKKRYNKNYKIRKRVQRQIQICSERGKHKHVDIVAARKAAASVLESKGWVLYPYYCPCGFWHLTKRIPETVHDEAGPPVFIMSHGKVVVLDEQPA